MGAKTLFLAAGHGGTDRGNTSTGLVEAEELRRIVGGMRRMAALLGLPAGLGGIVFLPDELDLAGELRALQGWRPAAADGDLAVDWHLDYRAGGEGALVLVDEQPRSARIAGTSFSRRRSPVCSPTGTTTGSAMQRSPAEPKAAPARSARSRSASTSPPPWWPAPAGACRRRSSSRPAPAPARCRKVAAADCTTADAARRSASVPGAAARAAGRA